MSDEIFRPRRTPETGNPLESVGAVQQNLNQDLGRSDEAFNPAASQGSFAIQGNPPKEFLQALQNSQKQTPPPQKIGRAHV